MSISSIEAKTFRDRLGLSLTSGAGLAVMAVFAVWVFSSVGQAADKLLDDLPEALSSLIGASGGGNYAVSELFSLIAPIVVLVVAISAGAHSVAGEERDHTAALLLAQPVTRRHLVSATAGVLVSHVLITTALFLSGFLLASAIFGTGVSNANACAAGVHLAALGVAFGMIASAISARTGSTIASLGITSGLAITASLTASMLPIVQCLEQVAKISPWFYYDGSHPLSSGVDPTHLLVLVAIAAAAFAVALIAVDRRDIGSGDERGLIAMIPPLDRYTRPSIKGVGAKALSERLVLVSIAGGYVAAVAIGVCLMYKGLERTLAKMAADLPRAILGMVGGADIATPVGWIESELLSIMLPLVLIGVAATLGADAIAGEQKRHTLGLLLAAPVSRRRVVIEKFVAMVIVVVTIAALWGAGLAAGSAVAGLGLSIGRIASAMAHLALLAALFGAIGLAFGSITTSHTALRSTITLAVAAYFVEAFFPLASVLKGWAALSPWHYFSSAHPLTNGADFADLSVLGGLTALAVFAAVVLVDRREVTA